MGCRDFIRCKIKSQTSYHLVHPSQTITIDGKSYEMKGKQKIGVLAQEIKEVFPELVSEDDNEMLAVNYQGLVPVLINALKEQDAKMKEQEKNK